MFANTQAFSGFAVPDLQEAERFYGDTLGIDVTRGEMGDLTLKLAGGRDTFIYEKPDFVPATYTILNFVVDDVDEAVVDLTDKGIQFEQYDEFDQDEKGVARGNEGPAIAWFKDPAGNILSVLEAS
ncbi:MAG TPA: VOC family protein [Acidimicrobiia bacterium]|jgi:catechol 2,3-dioxygenase-like lactoylglutathione lyase family enzyme|nr:VOC family protein [Acidimicrobiia bacterium]